MKRLKQFIKTAFSIIFTCSAIVAPISASAQSSSVAEAVTLPAINYFLPLKNNIVNVIQQKGFVMLSKFGPEPNKYGSASVEENYNQHDFLSDEINSTFKTYASDNGWDVKVYKPGLSNVINTSFPNPNRLGYSNNISNLSLKDYSLIAYDKSGRIKAVMFRWFSIFSNRGSQHQWLQFTYVIDGSAAKTIEKDIIASMLSEFLLPQ